MTRLAAILIFEVRKLKARRGAAATMGLLILCVLCVVLAGCIIVNVPPPKVIQVVPNNLASSVEPLSWPVSLVAESTNATNAPVGASVTLSWDRDSGTNAVGYRVHYYSSSPAFTNVIDAGSATNLTISTLVGGVLYYFAVTAYNAAGVESAGSAAFSASAPLFPFPLTDTVDYRTTWVTNLTIRFATNQVGIVRRLPTIWPVYVATNMNLTVPCAGPWTVWTSTNLWAWSIYATGAAPSVVRVPIGPVPARFFRAHAP